MAYHFGTAASSGDVIDCGTTPSKASTWSLQWLGALANASDTPRLLVGYRSSSAFLCQLFAGGVGSGNNNQITASFSKNGFTAFPFARYTTGISAATVHSLVATYDGANIQIYLDTNASAVATQAETGTPDQDAGQHFYIGNRELLDQAAEGNAYAVGYWPGVVLTGAQAAFLGAGYDAAYLFAPYHWRLGTNANARRGGAHGTVTGAFVVSHAANMPIIYPPEGLGLAS